MTSKPKVEVRPATPADLNFVHSSWHTSYWKLYARHHIKWALYRHGQDALINRLTGRSHILVAYMPSLPDEILGWACIEYGTVHWVYVKASYRRLGIARGLVRNCDAYTQKTDSHGSRFTQACGLEYNPYLSM